MWSSTFGSGEGKVRIHRAPGVGHVRACLHWLHAELAAVDPRLLVTLGATAAKVAQRSQRNNRGTQLGEALARVSAGIAEDVETFQTIMRRLGIRINPVKIGLAVGAERLGRLKLNG